MDAKKIAEKIKYLEINTNHKVDEVFSGNYKSSFRGLGLEFSDLRKYEEGDDARYIDWITSAKQGVPFVKKFQETRELTLMMLIDVSSSMKFTTQAKDKSQIALELEAHLLFSALKNNDKFGAIIFSNQIHSFIPPKKGRSHLLRILRETIKYADEPDKKNTDLKIGLDILNKTIKRRSVCFLLSDNLTDGEKETESILRVVNKKHDFIYVNICDPLEKEIKENLGSFKMINPETGESEIINLKDNKLIQRYNNIRKEKEAKEMEILKKNKIDYLQISTISNIYKELLLFFKKRTLKN